jgi:hypothetical protein
MDVFRTFSPSFSQLYCDIKYVGQKIYMSEGDQSENMLILFTFLYSE